MLLVTITEDSSLEFFHFFSTENTNTNFLSHTQIYNTHQFFSPWQSTLICESIERSSSVILYILRAAPISLYLLDVSVALFKPRKSYHAGDVLPIPADTVQRQTRGNTLVFLYHTTSKGNQRFTFLHSYLFLPFYPSSNIYFYQFFFQSIGFQTKRNSSGLANY